MRVLSRISALALILAACPPVARADFAFSLSYEIDSRPVSVTGQLAADNDRLQLRQLTFKAPGTELEGRGSVTVRNGRPRARLVLNGTHLDLLHLLAPLADRDRNTGRVFPADPLPLDFLRTWDGTARISLDRLTTPVVVLEDVSIPLRLEAGLLEIEDLTGKVAGGVFSGGLLLSTEDPPRARAWLQVEGLQPALLPHAEGEPWVEGAITNVHLQGRGSGRSIAQMMARADGRLLIHSGAGTLPDGYVKLFGANLFWNLFQRVNPLRDRERDNRMECFVMHFAVRDGIAVADRGVVLQTGDVDLIGSGEVDLESEIISLGFRPQARNALSLDPGALTNVAFVRGTLADPDIQVDPASAALGAGVTAGAAVATFGVSLLVQKLYSLARVDPRPCQTALGERAAETLEKEL